VIAVTRPTAEPSALATSRGRYLARAREANDTDRPRQLTGYGKATIKKSLFRAQREKCAYCEWKVPAAEFQDVEHYRPKVHYWWLCWEWGNLLFACYFCNRVHKKNRFPLADEATRLRAEDPAPGDEVPLILDPTAVANVSDHIRFRRVQGRWRPVPVNGSIRGSQTIEALGLAQPPMMDHYQTYFEQYVKVMIENVVAAIDEGDSARVRRAWTQATMLLDPEYQFAALSWGALDELVPARVRSTWSLTLPAHP
jgi:uncharacterized protein (TIGR02646 family)